MEYAKAHQIVCNHYVGYNPEDWDRELKSLKQNEEENKELIEAIETLKKPQKTLGSKKIGNDHHYIDVESLSMK